jgi:integrase
MPELNKKLTDSLAAKCEPPKDKDYLIYLCKDTPGFGVRVGRPVIRNDKEKVSRAYIMDMYADGKRKRRTIGKATGRGAISAEDARIIAKKIAGELVQGVDRSKIKTEERRAEQQAKKEVSLTLAVVLREYVEGKRRGKDGLALKERTKADYLAMVELGGTKLNGEPKQDGALYSIADTPITHITGEDIRQVYAEALKRGQRQATYAMQVLRAVLNWHGVKVPDNPLGKEVAGRDRIVLAPTKGDPKPIPPEYLGAWWNAACKAGTEKAGGSGLAGDYYRFQLLTGCRGVEILGDAHGNEPIRVRDVDIISARIVLSDTKNRKDHTLLLSRQALEIVKRNMSGKKPGAKLFPVDDPRKTLQAINKAAGMASLACQGHDLRATFASVADELVSSNTVKHMMNHAAAGDVTANHYISKGETQLRDGWQKVADFIANQIPDKRRKSSMIGSAR